MLIPIEGRSTIYLASKIATLFNLFSSRHFGPHLIAQRTVGRKSSQLAAIKVDAHPIPKASLIGLTTATPAAPSQHRAKFIAAVVVPAFSRFMSTMRLLKQENELAIPNWVRRTKIKTPAKEVLACRAHPYPTIATTETDSSGKPT